MSISVDLVVPFYNPSPGWATALVERFEAICSVQKDDSYALILVDDGSDNREAVEKELRVLEDSGMPFRQTRITTNRGKGYALREGISQSTSAFTVFTDIDFPYTTESIHAIIGALRQGADVALGYREKDYYASVPWFRKGLSEMFRFVLRNVMKFPITDTQCGLKGMNAQGRAVFLKTSINRFLVDMEFIKLAGRNHEIAIRPVVVKLRNDVKFSTMGADVIAVELINFIRIIFL